MDNLLQIFQQEALSGHFSFIILLISFLGGVIASLSPCSLGILPIIVGYIGGYSEHKSSKTAVQMFFFVLGLALVLTGVGIICALTGKVFASLFMEGYGALILAGLILIFGLNLIGVMEINFPVLIKKFPEKEGNDIILFPMLIGAFFALAATPCSTPILAGIMALATLSKNIVFAAMMLLLFSLGQGLIIIIAGYFTSLLKNLRGFAKFSEILVKLSGVVLILAAFYLYYHIFEPFLGA